MLCDATAHKGKRAPMMLIVVGAGMAAEKDGVLTHEQSIEGARAQRSVAAGADGASANKR